MFYFVPEAGTGEKLVGFWCSQPAPETGTRNWLVCHLYYSVFDLRRLGENSVHVVVDNLIIRLVKSDTLCLNHSHSVKQAHDVNGPLCMFNELCVATWPPEHATAQFKDSLQEIPTRKPGQLAAANSKPI
jgi:hypothetical protein